LVNGSTRFVALSTLKVIPGGHPLKLTTQVRVVPDKVDHQFVPKPPATSGKPAASR